MQYQNYGETFFVYIEQGETVLSTLTKFCEEHKISNGQVSGIGAVKEIEIGAYDLENQVYIKKTIPEILELVSCQGNVTLLNEKPFLHLHVTLSDHSLQTKAGHLFEMTVAAVGEFIIRKLDGAATREFNPNIGLASWCLASKADSDA